jgi:hypothetical protein
MDRDISGIILTVFILLVINIAFYLIVNDWKGKE